MRTEEMAIFTAITELLVEILDVDGQEITLETYLMRDLGAESIDLMELAVSLNERFNMTVNEDLIFLKTLRPVMERAHATQSDEAGAVAEIFFFLTPQRISEIQKDLANGPVLKVKDMVQYINNALHPKGASC